jgi:isoleucyl-tRNA synthetase
MDLRSTLNLPDPDFTIPMKADLPNLEPKLQAIWNESELYHRIQDSRKDAPAFVLHDGPPYTNSPIHMGTAMNKILKDFVVKSRTMMGFRSPYVPGFDNHGLPIEQTVLKKLQDQKLPTDVLSLRKACRSHAAEYIDVQTTQFQRLGIFGLWERPYTTMDYRFEAGIVRVFKRLVERGFVYKGLRPTLWSPTSRTALADTEIVYEDHTSKAIYVRFPLLSDPNRILEEYPNSSTIIWTTTPWTIPANLAVAFHPEFEYAVVRVGGDHYVIAAGLVESVAAKLGWSEFEVVAKMDGITFDHMEFRHPAFERKSIAVMADYVTIEDGTGVVHTAPGHGRDDFFTGVKYGLDILCPVDEGGVLTEEAGEFAGVYYTKCDVVVVDRLRELGALLSVEDYHHSYPHAERDGKPVIFRATEQWFIHIDHDNLRERMLNSIVPVDLETSETREGSGVCFVPETGHNRISAMVTNRPDWCISRQRPWGVGIPIFYGAKSRKPVLDPNVIEYVAQLVEREGSDAWFDKEASAILPPGFVHPETGETEFTKETDVLDVWFDSGSTSLCVFEGEVEPQWSESLPADVYLEGSDQHRGWFNSSLVIGMALRDEPPYRQLVTHGFILDDKGRKMSKREGNAIDPVEASNKYGADVVRAWVASVDFTNDAPCSDALLKQVGEMYRSVRNTLRFLLANLSDYEPGEDGPLLELDEWVVEQTDLLCEDVVRSYRSYAFGAAWQSIHNFCVNELSRFYLDAIKDRMYCDGADWPSRRSGQRACHLVLKKLVKLLSPILVHTCEETWQRIPGAERESIHLQTFEVPSDDRLGEIEASELQRRFASLLAERGDLFASYETWKVGSGVKDSQDVIAVVRQQGDELALLQSFTTEELALYFKMSWVELSEGEEAYEFRESDFAKCDRSRLRRPDVLPVVADDGSTLALTSRDRRVLGYA